MPILDELMDDDILGIEYKGGEIPVVLRRI
jgi:hypothetical protein